MKKVLALVLAMVTSMSLVACGGGADTAGSSDGASGSGEEKTVTLSLAHIRPVDSSAILRSAHLLMKQPNSLMVRSSSISIRQASWVSIRLFRRESALVT